MAIININKDIKAIIERISKMCFDTEAILNFCMEGFMKHKMESIDEAKKLSQAIHEEENELMNVLSDKGVQSDADKDMIKSLMAVIGNVEMAITGIDDVLRHVQVKVNEGILFSDKGVSEIGHLFRETIDVLTVAGDTILTKNEILKNHILDKCANINRTVDIYSEEHEERLIKGLCQPQSSTLYLSIVNSLTKVIWHTKQAIDRFFMSK
ncbi:MAG: hypothetical protein E3K32_02530 [wastewater metagenome]|nr:hypothetical protein [Candidatus Loosdrechtia aerotolerans]